MKQSHSSERQVLCWSSGGLFAYLLFLYLSLFVFHFLFIFPSLKLSLSSEKAWSSGVGNNSWRAILSTVWSQGWGEIHCPVGRSKPNTDTQPGTWAGQYLWTCASMFVCLVLPFIFVFPKENCQEMFCCHMWLKQQQLVARQAGPQQQCSMVWGPSGRAHSTTSCLMASLPAAASRWQPVLGGLLSTLWSSPASDRITAQGYTCLQANYHTRGCDMTGPGVNPSTGPALGAALCHRMNELCNRAGI